VLPGLIDTHAHVFQFVTGRFGLEADLCGVRSGVTTLVDQGGPSCMTLPAFREFVVNAKESRVLAFLSRIWSAAWRVTITRPSTSPTAWMSTPP
jgi:dihydroorotase